MCQTRGLWATSSPVYNYIQSIIHKQLLYQAIGYLRSFLHQLPQINQAFVDVHNPNFKSKIAPNREKLFLKTDPFKTGGRLSICSLTLSDPVSDFENNFVSCLFSILIYAQIRLFFNFNVNKCLSCSA